MDDDYDYDDQSAQCPHCSGWGFRDCHCGGDLCVCDNYGEEECRLCFGEGVVSTARWEAYMELQRENARLFASAPTTDEATK